MNLSQLKMYRGRQQKQRQGASVVELAILLPVLCALLLGICEIGQALKVTSVLSEASRNACASGSRAGCANADVISDMQSPLTVAGLPANAATVTILVNGVTGNVATAKRNDKITVIVSIPWADVSIGGTSQFFFRNLTLSQTTSMLKQG